jgi:hypothetical protein
VRAQGSGGGDFRFCDLQRWFGFVAFRYWAGTGFSKTMKFSLLVSAASEHRLAVGTWISNVDGGAQQRSADIITAATPKMAALVGRLQPDLGHESGLALVAGR